MQKDFDNWNNKKKVVNNDHERPFFHEGEIWYVSMGLNVGFEQDGKGEDYLRPMIIFRKFNNEIFWGLPLTRTDKNSKYYYKLFDTKSFEDGSVILSQIKLVDSKRLSHKIGNVSSSDIKKIKEKFKALIP